MQRYNLNLKSGTYTQGDCYKLIPIYRQQVVPGQTINLDAEVSMKSAAFTQNVTTPSIMSVWFFYVPHRLVWEGWTDFISKEEGAPTFPATTDASGTFFEHNGGGGLEFSPLYRRAYKLVYNEYFGTESVGSANEAWYDDITDDSVFTLYRTRNPEDFASKIVLDGTVVDPEFTVTASSIPLNDFYRQMMNARSTQRSQMTGNKYVDTLARMGVDASWMINERPEFLGTKSKMVGPQITANTSDTNTGDEVARFTAKIGCSLKSKHFAEHGYIVGVCSMRPMVIANDRGNPDGIKQYGSWIDTFYSSDNLETKDQVNARLSGFSNDNAWTQRFGYLKNGTWLRGNGNSWVIKNNTSSMQGLIYPDSADIPTGDELGTEDYAATSSFTMTGKTPVPQRVA